MREPQYRYNPKSLRYEPVRFSVWRAISSFIAYGVFGFLFFVGLNLLLNLFIETNVEKSLTSENQALSNYKVVLASQVANSNEILDKLKADETDLHEKLFKIPTENETAKIEERAPMVADTESWDESVELIEQQYLEVSAKAKQQNRFFADRLSVTKNDFLELVSLPSIAPVKDLNNQNLVSGFGVRINPFHKGNYHHDGMDIALPQGTEVLATGNGRVISVNKFSWLKAGFGNYIDVDHGYGMVTRYAHLDQINVVWGQKIMQGQVIGLSGSSGGSVAPHLHYEIIKHGKNVDPLTYIIEGIDAKNHQQLALTNKKHNQSLD
ncbi:MAG: M23 family metallopeptidase [Bacteroidetes bacterium]|nr:M23 family metallopeptidase [Bacteroidota bacterium]